MTAPKKRPVRRPPKYPGEPMTTLTVRLPVRLKQKVVRLSDGRTGQMMKGETKMRSAEHGASRPTLPRPARTVPPYHTGKVSIGCAWQPRQRPYHDADALLLQRALLGERRRPDWDGIAIVIFTVAAVALAAWLL